MAVSVEPVGSSLRHLLCCMVRLPLKILKFPQAPELVVDCLSQRSCLLEVVPFLDHLSFGTRAFFVRDGTVANQLCRAGIEGVEVPCIGAASGIRVSRWTASISKHSAGRRIGAALQQLKQISWS
jgi:hypothetical protein